MDEMTFVLGFERPAYKQSELGRRRNNTSRYRKRRGPKAQKPKSKKCSGKNSISFNKHY